MQLQSLLWLSCSNWFAVSAVLVFVVLLLLRWEGNGGTHDEVGWGAVEEILPLEEIQ
jgi:hypothetical protein